MPTFGQLLKIDRERLQLSQEELARRIGVSQQAVANWENGTSHPRKDRRVQLLQVLGPDAELVKNPPTTEFIPAKDMPADLIVSTPKESLNVEIKTTPGVAIAGGARAGVHAVPSRAAVGTPGFMSYTTTQPWVGFSTAGGKTVHVQAERTKMLGEFEQALPDQFKPNVGAELMFGQVARSYDYASTGVIARVMRGVSLSPASVAFHLVRLAMAVPKHDSTPEPTASVVLFILSDEPAAAVTRRMGSLHFDAMTLGIKIETVRDAKEMAKAVVELERMYHQDMQDFHSWMEEMRRDAAEYEAGRELDTNMIFGRQPSDAEPPPNPDEGTW